MGKLSVCGVLACATLLVTGCGGSDDGDALGAAAVAVTTTIPPEEAVALAQSAVLTPAEVDGSWVPIPREAGAQLYFLEGPSCAELDALMQAPGAAADFHRPEHAFANHDVKVVGEDAAQHALAVYRAPETADCFAAAHSKAIEPIVEVGSEITVNVLPSSLESNGASTTYMATINVVMPSGAFTVTSRETLIVAGPAYAIIGTSDTPQTAHDALVATAKAKLDAVGATS